MNACFYQQSAPYWIKSTGRFLSKYLLWFRIFMQGSISDKWIFYHVYALKATIGSIGMFFLIVCFIFVKIVSLQ
jgi:hypothetical protein